MAPDGEQQTLDQTVDDMLKTLTDLAAKVVDLALQTAALKPLLPLAKQLDGLPHKVTKLQAAAFEGSNQISTLNVAVSRLEKAQRGDQEVALEDAAYEQRMQLSATNPGHTRGDRFPPRATSRPPRHRCRVLRQYPSKM
ncbi:hypothetical protein C2845_PM13G06540 [Panicum miliaceum]|uniref:Tobamovirus multiplication protein 2B n=1 Tax=Panicum miliaceum TaxID=4540 RepID=A0A3L6RHA1_PANMI|nr:hypothetical protein C2845_PM13G06540 [Panicum miliaceum]